MNIIQQIEAEEAQRLAALRKTPEFRPGDTLRVNVRIKEGERVQPSKASSLAHAGAGCRELTVRKITSRGRERVSVIRR